MTHTKPDQVIYGENDLTDHQVANSLIGRQMHIWDGEILTHALVGTNKTLYETPLVLTAHQMHAVLDLTAVAGTEAGDHLDLYIDASLDDGVTWYNVVHFTQLAGNNTVPKKYMVVTSESPSAAASYDDITGDLGAAAAPRHFIGNRIRVRGTTADLDADAAWTLSLTIIVH